MGQSRKCRPVSSMSASPTKADIAEDRCRVRLGRVEDGRGSLGHSATLRFPSPLIEPDVPISGIRLSDWLHREIHGEQTNARGFGTVSNSPSPSTQHLRRRLS